MPGELERTCFAFRSALPAVSWLRQKFAVSGHREQRPAIAVHVVLEIEDFWETCAGCFEFRPGAIRVLCPDQVINTTLDAFAIGIAEGTEAHDGPCGLRGRAGAPSFEHRVIVGIATLAPATVIPLDALEPIASLEEPRLIHVDVQRAQP